jgi:hypothetical protein
MSLFETENVSGGMNEGMWFRLQAVNVMNCCFIRLKAELQTYIHTLERYPNEKDDLGAMAH